jgi:tetratricopeptide (TPR) repeat protein
MKFRILSAFALACALSCAAAAQGDKGAQGGAKVSGGEKDAAAKIDKAKGAEAKLQAAAAFVKKYPQRALRRQVADGLAQEIANETDPQAKVSLAQTFLDIFNQPDEAQLVNASLLSGYINTGQTPEAIKLGTDWLAKHPDDIGIMQNLAILASNEAIKGNTSFAAQGRQYGMKAVEMLEADKMPEGFDAAKWPEFKSSTLVALYRALGVLLYKAGDSAAALPQLEKAAALKSTDPGVYLLLSELNNDAYEMRAKEYNVAPAAEKAAALEKVNAALDKVIDSYAQAIAITDGNTQYAPVNAAIRQDYEKYYKFRHKNSADGMQQLIDKYKRPAQ